METPQESGSGLTARNIAISAALSVALGALVALRQESQLSSDATTASFDDGSTLSAEALAGVDDPIRLEGLSQEDLLGVSILQNKIGRSPTRAEYITWSSLNKKDPAIADLFLAAFPHGSVMTSDTIKEWILGQEGTGLVLQNYREQTRD